MTIGRKLGELGLVELRMPNFGSKKNENEILCESLMQLNMGEGKFFLNKLPRTSNSTFDIFNNANDF